MTDPTLVDPKLPPPPASTSRENLLTAIETILSNFYTLLLSPSEPLALPIPSRSSRNRTFNLQSPTSTFNLSVHLSLLSTIHHLLSTNSVVTKRDIYYRNPSFYRSQTTVDHAIDDIAFYLKVPRHQLNVIAASKGLVKGGITLVTNGNRVRCGTATLIPPGCMIQDISVEANTKWVLLVEKESIFQRLTVPSGGIIVTGKGYTDIATRELLRRLADMGLRTFALVDYDPHGIAIMAAVRFSERSVGDDGKSLCCRNLEWIGPRMEDVEKGWIALKENDRQTARRLLGKEWMGSMPEWKQGIQRMLWFGWKAEINALRNQLQDYVERRVEECFAQRPVEPVVERGEGLLEKSMAEAVEGNVETSMERSVEVIRERFVQKFVEDLEHITEPIVGTIQELTEAPVEGPVMETMEKSMEESMESPAEEMTVEEIVKKTTEETAMDTMWVEDVNCYKTHSQGMWELMEETMQVSMEWAMEANTQETMEGTVDGPAEETMGKLSEEPANMEGPTEEPAKEPVEQSVDEPKEYLVEKTTEKAEKKMVEKTMVETIKELVEVSMGLYMEGSMGGIMNETAEEKVKKTIDETVEKAVEGTFGILKRAAEEELISDGVDHSSRMIWEDLKRRCFGFELSENY
jgi:meiotic recombination protein SPO11